MQDKLRYIFTGNIGRKIWTTLGLILIYRVLLNIPLPGFTSQASMNQQSSNGAFILVEFVDMLSGGSLLKTSILGLGLFPYLFAQQLIQLSTPIIPALQRLIIEDPSGGRRLLEKWTYYLTVPLGIIEALLFIGLITMNCNNQKFLTMELNSNAISKITLVSILVAGSFFTIWIAMLISEFGLREQGMAIIIFSGIVSRLPNQISELFASFNPAKNITIYIIIFLVSIVAVIYLQSARRNVPLEYPGRRMGNRMSMPVKGTLPILLNMGGSQGFIGSQLLVAIATFYAPLATCTSTQWINALALGAMSVFSEKGLLFGPIVFFSVFIFSILYSKILFEEQNYGENLKRVGASVPGVHTGEPTRRYLEKINLKISIGGGFMLGLIAIAPWLFNIITGTNLSLLDGEKIVIMVSVLKDTFMGIDAEIKLHSYQDLLRV